MRWCEPAPARHGLHRPLPPALLRPVDAGGGDSRRPRRPGARLLRDRGRPLLPARLGAPDRHVPQGRPAAPGSRLARPGRYRYENVGTVRAFDTLEALEALGKESGRTLPELAIGWLAAQPVVSSVLVGATTSAQVAANAAAAATCLTDDEVAAVSELTAAD